MRRSLESGAGGHAIAAVDARPILSKLNSALDLVDESEALLSEDEFEPRSVAPRCASFGLKGLDGHCSATSIRG